MDPQNGIAVSDETACFHCGETLENGVVVHDGKPFCCAGCKAVYSILRENDLCDYYSIQSAPGVSQKDPSGAGYAYLDDPGIGQRLLDFSNDRVGVVTLVIPGMHCSSCVWLLEHLHKIDQGIVHSRVNFLKKEINIRFAQPKTTLRRIVELLATLGYAPELNLGTVERTASRNLHRSLYYRVGIAGFCFANIMLLSFPEYLSNRDVDADLRGLFSLMTVVLSLPVFFYCSSDYFRSALGGLRRGFVNLDVPIALGILILFLRSIFEIVVQTGPGFLDSLSGLVFFLLLGRLFQTKTYDSLNFERDYKAYFPLAVSVKENNGTEISIPVSSLAPGQRIVIRNGEIIPGDSVLIRGNGSIDYSFVTGESHPIDVAVGETVFAGGRQVGSAIELDIIKAISQSRLTQLWNDVPTVRDEEGLLTTLANRVSRYFTAGILLLAGIAGALWLPVDVATGLNAITGILIVACPCALALSTPFTFGTAQRIFGQNKFFLKNPSVVESLSRTHTIVFDKTGTLTRAGVMGAAFVGEDLTPLEKAMVSSLVRNSNHPLSRNIRESLGALPQQEVAHFAELAGEGIEGEVNGVRVCLGSSRFAGGSIARNHPADTRVHLSLDGSPRGYFAIHNRYRDGVEQVAAMLRERFPIIVLSGDGEGEREELLKRFDGQVSLHFHQSPAEKLRFIRSLEDEGRNVLMLGDGLNDAGALRESTVGIAVTEDIASFYPGCDAILDSTQFSRIPEFLRFCRSAVAIVVASFVISLLYNVVGLVFAFQGALSPIVAAILMPLSSITVVIFTTTSVRLLARKRRLS